jgi:Phosphoribosylaminoimidazole (AIR) synthetase
MSIDYKDAGVNIEKGYEAVQRIKKDVESTHGPEVIGGIGGFGGMFAPDVSGMTQPILVSGTDGVGTKLKLAFALDKHDSIGIDSCCHVRE